MGTHKPSLDIIRQWITEGDLKTAISQLHQLLESSPQLKNTLNAANHLSFRYQEVLKQIQEGTVTFEAKTVETNRITKKLLELLANIEAQEDNPEIDAEMSQYFDSSSFIQNAEKIINIQHSGTTNIYNHAPNKPVIPQFLTPTGGSIPENFQTRDEDIDEIYHRLRQKEKTLMLINGEGGIGKTTLAAKYWADYQSQYQHLAWIFCGQAEENQPSESQNDHIASEVVTRLALVLKIDMRPYRTLAEQTQEVKRVMLNLPQTCLLVLDNANNPEQIRYFLRAFEGLNWHILFTSRCEKVLPKQEYVITHLPPQKAKTLFEKFHTETNNDFPELLSLFLLNIGYNTLAITLFAKYLQLRNKNRKGAYSLQQLVDDFAKEGIFLAHSSYKIEHGYQKKEVNEILDQLYDHSQLEREEIKILSWFSVLPAEPISYSILFGLVNPDDEPAFENHLTSLNEKGWLTSGEDENGTTYKTSPVIQGITREKNGELLVDCEVLIKGLDHKLEYEGGIGHLVNTTYQEAVVYSRYGENVLGVIGDLNADLVAFFRKLGRFYKTTGNLEKALATFEEYHHQAKALSDNFPDDKWPKYSFAVSCKELGHIYQSLGNLKQALSFYKRFNQVSNENYETHPEEKLIKNALAISYCFLGIIHNSLGNLSNALGFFESYNQLEQELYATYSENISFKNNLAISYQFLGNTHSELGNLSEALGFYEEFNRLERELNTDYPQNVEFKNQLAISYQNLGNTHSALGNQNDALSFYEKFNRLEQELYAVYPQNIEFKNGLAVSFQKLGNTHSKLGNQSNALNFYEKYNRLEKELYAAYPKNVSFKNNLAISYQNLGEMYSALGNLSEALGFYKEYNRLEQELHTTYPQNVEFKNLLATSYSKLALNYQSEGKKTLAKDFYSKAEKHWIELTRAFPDYVEFKNNLDWVKGKLAEL